MSELLYAHCTSCGLEEALEFEAYGIAFALGGEVVHTLCIACQEGDARPDLKVVRD